MLYVVYFTLCNTFNTALLQLQEDIKGVFIIDNSD